MKKQIILPLLLIISSLIGLLGLQGYFLYTDFQEKAQSFENDINWALETALPDAKRHRKNRLKELVERDWRDTTLLKIRQTLKNDSTVGLWFEDPLTGESKLMVEAGNESDTANNDEWAIQKLLEIMNMGEETLVFFGITDRIDARRQAYQDTLSIDAGFLRSRLDELLATKSVSATYELDFIHKDSVYSPPSSATVTSVRKPINYSQPNHEVMLIFEKPFFNILERSSLILIASLAVILLIALSFVMLVKNINRQRKLAVLKDDFIDNMTHELLTPIATMKIALESMERSENQNNKEKTQKYLKTSTVELGRISDIVHNVLKTSLHEQKENCIHIEKTDVNELIQELIDYETERADKQVEFTFQTHDEATIYTDPEHLKTVLHNLFDNAIKYNQNDPVRIDLVLTRSANELAILIKDNGTGIAQNEQEKIFDKFHRVTGPNVEAVRGLGIGLYYVKNILARLQGRIELLDSSSSGSSFLVSFQTKE